MLGKFETENTAIGEAVFSFSSFIEEYIVLSPLENYLKETLETT